MYNSTQLYNNLNEKTVDRSHLQHIIELAKKEDISLIVKKLNDVLEKNPYEKQFYITVKNKLKNPLNAPKHDELKKEALDQCGRLKKGWRFLKGGNVTKAKPKPAKKQTEKTAKPTEKTEPKIEVEKAKPKEKITEEQVVKKVLEHYDIVYKKTDDGLYNQDMLLDYIVWSNILFSPLKNNSEFISSYDLYFVYIGFANEKGIKRFEKHYKAISYDKAYKFYIENQLNTPAQIKKQPVITTDFFKKMSVSELRKYTLAYYNEHLKGKKIEIKKYLKQVEFISKTGRKLKYPMYQAKAAAVEHLEELIKNSTYNNWGDRKTTDNPTVLGYLNFKSKVVIDNEKRHLRIAIQVNRDREFFFKSFDVGIKKEKSVTPSGARRQSRDEESLLSHHKDTKKSLNAPKNDFLIPMNENPPKNELFNIPTDLKNFLGNIEKKPKHSVAVTLDATQGAGKTRFFYYLMDELASTKNKCLFISLEEHPLSELAQAKKRQYIKPKNQSLIDMLSELPDYKQLCKIINDYDCVFIDSWGKMQNKQKLDFDNDLRKKFNSKLFFVIFQRTVTQTMRGGAAAQFDGDIIMKIYKEPNGDFKKNYVYYDKNRYQNKDLNKLKFNIHNQKLI